MKRNVKGKMVILSVMHVLCWGYSEEGGIGFIEGETIV